MNDSISGILMSLLLFSGVAFGLTSFYVSTAEIYGVPTSDLEQINTTFNHYHYVNDKLDTIRVAIENTNILNPLTWGNVVTLVISVFLLVFDLPALFHSIMTDAVMMTPIIPAWSVWVIEGAILITVVFAVLGALNKTKV